MLLPVLAYQCRPPLTRVRESLTSVSGLLTPDERPTDNGVRRYPPVTDIQLRVLTNLFPRRGSGTDEPSDFLTPRCQDGVAAEHVGRRGGVSYLSRGEPVSVDLSH